MDPSKHIAAHLLTAAPVGDLLHDIQARLISNPNNSTGQPVHEHSSSPAHSHSNVEGSCCPSVSANQIRCVIQPGKQPWAGSSTKRLEQFDEDPGELSVRPHSPPAAPAPPQMDSSTPSAIYSTSMQPYWCQNQSSRQSQIVSFQANLTRRSIDSGCPSGSGPCQGDHPSRSCEAFCMPSATPESRPWKSSPSPKPVQVKHKESPSRPFSTVATIRFEGHSISSPQIPTLNEVAERSDGLDLGNTQHDSSNSWSLPVMPNDFPCQRGCEAWCSDTYLDLQPRTAEKTSGGMPQSVLLQPDASKKAMVFGSISSAGSSLPHSVNQCHPEYLDPFNSRIFTEGVQKHHFEDHTGHLSSSLADCNLEDSDPYKGPCGPEMGQKLPCRGVVSGWLLGSPAWSMCRRAWCMQSMFWRVGHQRGLLCTIPIDLNRFRCTACELLHCSSCRPAGPLTCH